MTGVNVTQLRTSEGQEAIEGSRPIAVNARGKRVAWDDMPDYQRPKIVLPNGLIANSMLRKDEWERLDRAVVEAAKTRLNISADLVARGLTQNVGSIGVMTSQYNRASDVTGATVSMSMGAADERDRVDHELAGVPIPVVHKTYSIDRRALEASRMSGSDIETSHARETARVVAEAVEDLVINGRTSLTWDGNTIYGLTSEPQRNTDTAASFGGGDWGTLGNAEDTIAGMINTLHNDRMYGPFGIWAATTQFNEAHNKFHADGSGHTPADRIMRLSGVESFEVADEMSDGEVVVVQLTEDVIDLAGMNLRAEDFILQNVEWQSPDGSTAYFKVFAVVTVRAKHDYNNRSGIAHATGA